MLGSFYGLYQYIFKTLSYYIFKTLSYYIFKTLSYYIFKTLSFYIFKTLSYYFFKTLSYCFRITVEWRRCGWMSTKISSTLASRVGFRHVFAFLFFHNVVLYYFFNLALVMSIGELITKLFVSSYLNISAAFEISSVPCVLHGGSLDVGAPSRLY